jgi:hypothetical protein
MAWFVTLVLAVGSTCSPGHAAAQSREAMRDMHLSQRLYQDVAEHFHIDFVEVKVGTLRTGGRIAQVVITDSVTFHADPEAQRKAARPVAEYVMQQLSEEKDLRTVRIGWKYAPAGGMSTAATYDFSAEELAPAAQQSTPS